jgi:hypothetical protein
MLDFVEQRVAAGHRRRGQRGADRVRRRRPRRRSRSARPARRHPAAAARDDRRAGRRAPRQRRGLHRPHRPPRRPTGYGRIVRGNDDRVRRIVEHSDATADERPSTRSTPASTASAAACSPPPAAPQPRERPGRVLPDRRRRGARRGRPPGRHLRGPDPDETHGVNDRRAARGRPRPSCGPAPTSRLARARGHHGRPREDLRRCHRRLAPDVTLFPGVVLQGTPSSVPTPRSARHPPGRLRRREERSSSSRPSPATPRSATTPGRSVRRPGAGRRGPPGTTTGAFYTAVPDSDHA